MSYATYNTDAIVCGTYNRNTADRSYLLFTREAGMLYAEAKSAREERSRQRMALQDFSLVRVSLIKGKNSWKIGSIEPKGNFYTSAADKAARGSVVMLTKFLRRFYGGQEAAPQLFEYVRSALSFLAETPKERALYEQIILVRLLLELGYVDERVAPPVVKQNVSDFTDLTHTDELRIQLQPIIDKAVSLSQL